MKYIIINIIALFFITIFISSCDPNVVFDEPMPPKVKALQQFPDYFQGAYLLESDSSIIQIKNNLIIQEENLSYTTNVYELTEQENCSFLGNEIFFEDSEVCLPFIYLSEDSIKIIAMSSDTIFNISEDEVLKYYKGSLFFNIYDEYGYWITLMLEENTLGQLELRLFQVSEDILLDKLKGKYTIINSSSYDKKYLFSPNKRDFKLLTEIISEMEILETLTPINDE